MRRIVRFYARRGPWVLVIAVIVTAIAASIALHLRLDADLERLLPDSAPSVRGLRQLEKSYGIIGRVSIVLQNGDQQELKHAADDVGALVAKMKDVDRVEVQRPVDFVKKNRLLYIKYDDLKTLQGRIEKRIKWEKVHANPLFVDVSNSKPPEVKVDDIEKKYAQFKQKPYYCSAKSKMCVVFVFPTFSAGDLKRSATLLHAIRTKVEAKLAKDYPKVTVGLTGRYAKRVQQQAAINQDLKKATIIALVALFFFLLIYFRGILASIWVFIPLVMGTIWAFAWAELIFGSLNVLTAFFGAVLMGLGIDYGIHICSRYLEALEEQHDQDFEHAMYTTLASTGRAAMYAGLTTVIAFASLMVSSFRAFFEYGTIALGGMILSILANITVLPCILSVVAGTKAQPRNTMSVHVARRLMQRGGHGARVWRDILIGALVVLGIAAAIGLPRTAFEYDFRNVQTTNLESWKLDGAVQKILGTSQLPVVVLTQDAEHAKRVADELRHRTKTMPEGKMMGRVLTLHDVIPQRQNDKLAILKDLKAQFDKLPKKVIKGQVKDFYDEISRDVKQGQLTAAELPQSMSAPFRRIDDPNKTVVLGFPTTLQNNVKDMQKLAVLIRGLPGKKPGTKIDGINDSLLLVDIFDSVERDSTIMIGITLLGLIFTAFIAFRDPKRIALLLVTISASIFVATGLVGLLGIKFNFINMVIVPIWLGLGVDAAFHLMVRHEESPGEFDGFVATALAVSAAFITSMIGFGAMLVTHHKGLFSMGAIAVVGLGSILLTSIIIQSLVLIRQMVQQSS